MPTSLWGIDFDSKMLVTGSADKRVLAWRLGSSRNEPQVFRVPFRDERKKRAHSVAMDPLSRWVAYGVPAGEIAEDWSARIYIFDKDSGKVMRVLRGFDTRPAALKFSPDGSFIAATLSEGQGLRIWSTKSWNLIKKLDPVTFIEEHGRKNLDAEIEYHPGLTFNPISSRPIGLVMAGDSGIWLFGKAPEFKFVKWVRAKERYHSVKFSPDGRRIALGNRCSTDVMVFDVEQSIKNYQKFEPPATNHRYHDHQYLSQVEWSNNGKYLYAGGVYWKGNPDKGEVGNGIIQWDLENNNRSRIFTSGTESIMDLKAFGEKGVILASQDPLIKAYDGNGNSVLGKDYPFPIVSRQIDFRHWKGNTFFASTNGTAIAFKPYLDNRLIKFDLSKQAIEITDAIDFETTPSAKISINVEFDNLISKPCEGIKQRKILIDEKPFQLNPGETPRDHVIMPSGREIILATSDTLRLIRRNGRVVWEKPIQHEAFRVAVAGKSKVIVAGHGDGAIRWYDAKNGKLLLTLFIAPEQNKLEENNDAWQWVAWTPEGYYISSVDGDHLIGWLANDPNDSNNPIWYDFGAFKNEYYRPDVVERVLRTKDTREALRQANQSYGIPDQDSQVSDITKDVEVLAPTAITLLSPKPGENIDSEVIDLRFELRSSSNAIPEEVNVHLNGSYIKSITKGLKLNKVISIPISIPGFARKNKQEISIKLSAITTKEGIRRGVKPVIRELEYTGRSYADVEPRLFGLFVGISHYDKEEIRLRYAHIDAIQLKTFWDTQIGKPYRSIDIKVLSEREADRNSITQKLSWLAKTAEPDDYVMIFFAGHGTTLSGTDRYLYFTRTADPSDIKQLTQTSITDQDLSEYLGKIKARIKIVFLDTCRNPIGTGLRRIDFNALGSVATNYWNAIVFFAAGKGGYAFERNGHGVFTKAMLDGLNGRAELEPVDGAISIVELDRYIALEVNKKTNFKQQTDLIIPPDLGIFRHEPSIVKLEQNFAN